MSFISLATFLALTAGSPTPAKTEATCCKASKTKVPAKVAKSEGYICPLTGHLLPCPSCCPANAKHGKAE
jgi:hypothetical protein